MPHTHDARAPRPSTAPSDAPIAPAPRPSTAPSRARIAWLLALSLLAGWFLFWPGVELARDLTDPALSGPGIPRRAVRVHRALTTPFAEWAEARVASGAAATAPLHDVPSTEWPMFSAVFYLMGARALGEAAARGEIEESALGDPPARAIAAARALLLDPVHHSWVRTHWGEDYLHEENVFFRALLIGGLGADVAMTNDARARAVLLEQTESLAADLDRSPLGLLNDYPEECYPTPYLGELALAYFLTVPLVDGAAVRAGGHTPYFVWLAFLVYWALPISLWIVAWRALRASSGRRPG